MIRLIGTEEVFYQMVVAVIPYHIITSTSFVGTADDDKAPLLLPFDDGWYECRRMFITTT